MASRKRPPDAASQPSTLFPRLKKDPHRYQHARHYRYLDPEKRCGAEWETFCNSGG